MSALSNPRHQKYLLLVELYDVSWKKKVENRREKRIRIALPGEILIPFSHQRY